MNPLHQREVDDDAVVHRREAGDAVTSTTNGDVQPRLPPEAEGIHDIRYAPTPRDQRGPAIDEPVVDTARDFVLLGAGVEQVLPERLPQSLEGRPYQRDGNRVPVSISNTWAARGGHVHLSPVGPDKWPRFCRAIGREDWAESLTYEDAVLVAPKSQVQDVKKFVARIKAAGRAEHMSHAAPAAGSKGKPQ